MDKQKIILTGIIFLASFLRLYQLSLIPTHPTLDEVSIGYNAYSILKTGADEYGSKFPILLRAYDDWRPALYAYLVIPFIYILDLNVLAVRLPAALLSIISVIASYFLAREFLKLSKIKINVGITEYVPSLTAFFLAISPWHIYISRLGHEANIGLSFGVLGLLFFFKCINNMSKKSNLFLILSAVFFGLSFDSYQSEKIIVPLTLVILFAFFYKKLLSRLKIVIISILLFLVIISPIVFESFKPNALIRFSGTNVFSNHTWIEQSSMRVITDKKNNDLFGILVDNRRIHAGLIFFTAFLSQTNPQWLFTNVGGENFKMPMIGLFHPIEILFLFFGLIQFIRVDWIRNKYKILILFLSCVALLPGSITTDYPHAMRAFHMLPFPQFIEAMGAYAIFSYFLQLRYKHSKTFLVIGISTLFIVLTMWIFHAYFTLFKYEESYRFQHGVLQALSYAQQNQEKYDTVLVSNQGIFRGSYMYYLFSTKYDPEKYQKNGGTVSGWFENEHAIGKFEFKNPHEIKNYSPLFIITPQDLPENNVTILQKFYYLDGREAVWAAVRK